MKLLKIILQSKLFFILLFFLTFIYVLIITKIISYNSIYDVNDHHFIGIVTYIKKTDNGYLINLKAKENVIVLTNVFSYQLGDTIEVFGTLNIPNNNTIPNTFNYKNYLYNQKIFYTLKPTNILLKRKNTNLIYKIKESIQSYFSKFKSKDILNALLLGDLAYLDSNIYNSFQENGISHLLSISGIHISLIILLFTKLIKKKNIFYDFFLLFLILFIFLLTNTIPILRILIYQLLSIINNKLKLNIKTIYLFYLTLIITLWINPFYLYQKGFLYSYAISFILIKNKDNLTGNYFIKLLKISLISFIYSIPFNIYFNYSINLLSIIFNLFYVPLFTFIIIPIVFITPIIPCLDNILFFITKYSNQLSMLLNNISFGVIVLKKINIIMLIIYLILFYLIIKNIFQDKKRYLFLLIIILFIHSNINYIIKEKYISFIDVKQGDSCLIYNNNQTVLIDTGGLYNKNVSKDIITMLKSFGISKINSLILSHGDYDHMGEAINLVNSFKVEKVIFNCGEFNDLEKELIKVLDKKHIKYYSCIKELNIDNNKLYFLQTKEYDNENDNSNVIYTELNGYKFMFMGDAGVDKEKDILNKYNISDVDVLKVGHHGSKTSSSKDFIDKINPKYSIISVGKNNKYGHPNKDVLNNLEETKIYRTDQNGSIMFKIKNNKLKIETCSP